MKKEVSLHNLWGSILILLAGIVFLLFPIITPKINTNNNKYFRFYFLYVLV